MPTKLFIYILFYQFPSDLCIDLVKGVMVIGVKIT